MAGISATVGEFPSLFLDKFSLGIVHIPLYAISVSGVFGINSDVHITFFVCLIPCARVTRLIGNCGSVDGLSSIGELNGLVKHVVNVELSLILVSRVGYGLSIGSCFLEFCEACSVSRLCEVLCNVSVDSGKHFSVVCVIAVAVILNQGCRRTSCYVVNRQ